MPERAPLSSRSGSNTTAQTSGYVRPILYTDFNYPKWPRLVRCDVWELRAGQEVSLSERGETFYCHGRVIEPLVSFNHLAPEKRPTTRYARVDIIPDTWGHYGDEESDA